MPNDPNHNPFDFDLPSEWEDQTVYVFRGPNIGNVEHRLMVTIDRHLQHDNIADFAREKSEPITENLSGLEVIRDEDVTLENGNSVHEFICKWIPSDEKTIFKKYIFVLCHDMGFTFFCDFSKKSLKMLGGQMNDIIESLLPGTFEPVEDD